MSGFRILPRPGVEAELANILDYRVGVVCAPAGFGKHTALRGWAEQLQEEGIHVEWIDAEVEGKLMEAISCPDASKDSCVAIVEDFESVDDILLARSLAHQALKSAHVRCTVFVTDAVPRFGEIGLVPFMNCYVVGKEEFLFDCEEIERLYDSVGVPESKRRADYLVEQCGGWPFFVFAELAPASSTLSPLRKDEQRIAYLEGLISSVSEEERSFLERIGMLDSITVNLCGEILGDAFTADYIMELLGRLEQRGLAERLRRGWWRLYPPIRTYLVERFGVQRSLEARMRNRTAYRWYRQQDKQEEAARQMAMMVEESELLSITRDLLPSNVRLEEDLARQVAARPLLWLSSSPNACIIIALAYLFAGDGASALLWAHKLKTAFADMEDDTLRASFEECVPYLEQKAYVHLSENERSIAIGEALLASSIAPKSTAEGFVRHALGEAFESRGDLEGARVQYEAALALTAGASSPMLLAYIFYDLAWLLVRMGRANEAEAKCGEALQICPSRLPPYAGLQGLAALLRIERGESADLSFIDERGGELVSAVNNPDIFLDLNVLQARSAFMNGNPQEALSIIAGVLSEVRGQRVPRGAIVPALTERLAFALARDSISEAKSIYARMEDLVGEGASAGRLYLLASQARIALHEGDAIAANDAAARMKDLSLDTGARRFELQALVLQAGAAALCDDKAAVDHNLQEALRSCRATGAIYPFLEHCVLLRPHLFALASSRKLNYEDLKHAKRVLIAFERAGDQPADAGKAAGEGILTRKEREVLFLLSLGYSRDEMANALVVSVNTVKTHLNRLYAKLGAHNREDAVKTARSLGMLSD